MQQHFENYSQEDHQVWEILFERQKANLTQKAIAPFGDCLEKAKEYLHEASVPNFDLLNLALQKATNWEIEVVPGLIPVVDFFELLAKRRFPSSTWLRTMQELDYLEEPDMFHDIFGHVPLLFDPGYAQFMQDFGRLGMSCLDQPALIEALERLYWFTIEFGLCYEADQLQIIGAGILSSFGETRQLFIPEVCEFKAFEIESVLNHQFRKDCMQPMYYVLPNYQTMFELLNIVATKYALNPITTCLVL